MKRPTEIRDHVAPGIRRNDVRAAAKRLLDELSTLAGESPIENVTKTILDDLVALVRERTIGELDEAGRLLPEKLEVARLVADLGQIHRNDTTHYEHHQARPWDGEKPDDHGGTRWLEPKEIARAWLRWLGAPLPDAVAEAIERATGKGGRR